MEESLTLIEADPQSWWWKLFGFRHEAWFSNQYNLESKTESRNLRTLIQQFGPHLANNVVYATSKSAIMHV